MNRSDAPPGWMRAAAKRGLALRRQSGRGGLTPQQASNAGAGGRSIGSGVARARDLVAGRRLSRETLGKIVGFFSRHASNVRGPENSPGYVAGQLWGSPRAKAWAKRQIARIDKGGRGRR